MNHIKLMDRYLKNPTNLEIFYLGMFLGSLITSGCVMVLMCVFLW